MGQVGESYAGLPRGWPGIPARSGCAVEKPELFPTLVNEAPGLNVKPHRKLLSPTSRL